MITLYCRTNDYEAAGLPFFPGGFPAPVELLPLLLEEDLLRTPACEAVLERLNAGHTRLDSDPCYLVYRNGRRRPLICFRRSLQAALAVAAVASLPQEHPLLSRLRWAKALASGRGAAGWPCLALTPDLCDACTWEALNALDLPVALAGDVRDVARLRQALRNGQPQDSRPAPYRLVRNGRGPAVLTWQDTPGKAEDGTLLTDGDGFDLVGFHWQNPSSWCRSDLVTMLEDLPLPRANPAPPPLHTRYAIRDRLHQYLFPCPRTGSPAMALLQLEQDADGCWYAGERFLEPCRRYQVLFEEALQGAGDRERWVLVLDLDRHEPPCLRELTRCRLYYGFHLKRRTVTLTDGTDALRSFLKALLRYADAPPRKRGSVL